MSTGNFFAHGVPVQAGGYVTASAPEDLSCFNLTIVRGARSLGVELTREEARQIYHALGDLVHTHLVRI